MYMEYAVSGLQEGRYELINHNRGLGMRMTWDLSVFRYLWVWGLYCGIDEYPWYGRSYVMAVEPWSSMPGRLRRVQGQRIAAAAGGRGFHGDVDYGGSV